MPTHWKVVYRYIHDGSERTELYSTRLYTRADVLREIDWEARHGYTVVREGYA